MVFKHFRFSCSARVVLLGATLFLLTYLLWETTWYAAAGLCLVLILYQVYHLIRYTEKTNRDLTRFLESIRYSDFSQSFSDRSLGSSFRELAGAFNDVLHAFRRARTEREEQYRMLQTVVQHVGVGLIAFSRDGDVELINTAAKRLLGVPRLKNLHALESFSRPLVETLLQMEAGTKTTLKIEDHGELLHLALSATVMKLGGREQILVSLQNIQSELEEKEMEAWQNLIRVLTHEIMNSVTPIASLASTARQLLSESNEHRGDTMSMDQETIVDIRGAVGTIENRSQGLIRFVESYRKLTRIPKPNFQIMSISSLFGRVQQLMNGQIGERAIDLTVSVEPETLEITADPELIEQVLINLLMNSIQALEGQPHPTLILKAEMGERGRVFLQVVDNGPGIVQEAMDKIFVPFFTTKKEGSGIGLSLSRQIMRLHRGTISAQSKPNEETVFTLRF